MQDFEPKVYSEVWEIIRLMSEEMQSKIPERLKEKIKTSRDETFEVSLDEIEEDKISEDAKRILSVIYTDYLANEEERQIIKAKERAIARQKEQEAQEKYGTEIKFKESKVELQLVEIKKEKWYKKLLNKILRIFKKTNK